MSYNYRRASLGRHLCSRHHEKNHGNPVVCIVSKSCIQPCWFMFMCISACYPRQQRDGRQRVAVERQRASDVQTVGRHTPEHAEQAGLWLH